MSTYPRGQELAGMLAAAGVRAVTNPKDVNPPCVLIGPPGRRWDINLGFTAEWHLWITAPGEGTGETWQMLDRQLEIIGRLLPLETSDPAMLPPITGLSPAPAYHVIYREPLQEA